jgi:hypothetical protein
MLVELGLIDSFGDAVEVGEEVGGCLTGGVLPFARFAKEVVDQRLGVDFFLDVERRGVDDEV